MAASDGGAYDYASNVDFTQQPRGPIPLRQHPVPPASVAWMKAHPPDPNDPT